MVDTKRLDCKDEASHGTVFATLAIISPIPTLHKITLILKGLSVITLVYYEAAY